MPSWADPVQRGTLRKLIREHICTTLLRPRRVHFRGRPEPKLKVQSVLRLS